MTSLADGIRNACEIARRDERKKVIEKSWQWIELYRNMDTHWTLEQMKAHFFKTMEE